MRDAQTRLDRSLVFSSSWKRPGIINSRVTSISREREEGREAGARRRSPEEAGNQMAPGPRPVVPH